MIASPQSILRRTAAGTIDFAIALFLGFSFFSFVTIPIVNRFFDGDALSASLAEKQLESSLFLADESTGNIAPASEEQYPEALFRYYVLSGLSELGTLDGYYDDILLRGEEGCLFNFEGFIPDEDAPWIVPYESVHQLAVDSFYALAFQTAIDHFQTRPEVQELQGALSQRLAASLVATLLLVAFPFYVVLPMFHSGGATLGQRLLRLRHVDAFDRPLRKMQIAIKGMATLFFLGLGLLIGLPFFSYLVMIFHPRHISIPDYFAVTVLLDAKESK